MQKTMLAKPIVVMLYGYPGSGKSHFAKLFCDSFNIAYLHGDRIRHELFNNPTHSSKENKLVEHLMKYMANEFLGAGIGVVFDSDVSRLVQRRRLRELARQAKAVPLLIWLQIDSESAQTRIKLRDRRKNEDKYAVPFTEEGFRKQISTMQNPINEDYTVISGKHTFNTQKSAILKRMYELGVITTTTASSKVVKPGMINLVPNLTAGRVDLARRNITIK